MMKPATPFLGITVLAASLLTYSPHAALSQTTAPRLQSSNMTYLGAFALPQTEPLGTSSFNYGGAGVGVHKDAATGKRSLFMQGHAHHDGHVAQVEIPATLVKSLSWSSLPMATVLQNFRDVTDGKIGTAGNLGNGMPINGLLSYNNKLIVGVTQNYGEGQLASHGVSNLNLSLTNDFLGFYRFTGVVANSRSLGGYMTIIPPEWRSSFGGPALTGNGCRSIITTTSFGPSVTVFDPANVGSLNPIPGKTLLFYDEPHPVCGLPGCERTQNNIMNNTTRVEGIAFPSGSRSVLFFGTHGTGPYCYGTAPTCLDPTGDFQGPHAAPYRNQVWAFDANELVAVKNGTKEVWEVKPYAVWQFGANEMYSGANAPYFAGAGYDPETGRVYISHGSTNPRVDVYQITVPGGASDTTPPTVPANLAASAVSASQINLSWTASTDASGIAAYEVYRCTGSTCTPSSGGTLVSPANHTATTFSDTGLAAGATYRYQVRARDNASPANLSGFSIIVTATTGSASVPEVNVVGNGVDIVDGDTTPSTTDNTNFGSVDVAGGSATNTYTIQNTGAASLSIGNVTLSGSSDFAVISQPAISVAAGASTTFSVRFDPSAAGVRGGSLSFSNGDTNENPYNFSIQGTGNTTTTASIGVNLTDAANVLLPGDIVGVVPAANWNNSTANNGHVIDAKNNSGVATTADINFGNTAYLYSNNTGTLASPMTDDAKMMKTQRALSNSTSMSITATQIPYTTYDVYVYWGGRTPAETVPATMTIQFQQNNAGTWTTTHTKCIKDSDRVWDGTYNESLAVSAAEAIDGEEYVVFRNVTVNSFKLVATTGVRTGICGIQIVQK